MAQSNNDKLDTLMKEIDNLVTLLVKVDEGSEPKDTLTVQKQKVLDLLPVLPDDGAEPDETYPIHKLLLCRPLTQTQIPLDVLAKLIESGFDVNSRYPRCIESINIDHEYQEVYKAYSNIDDTCLNIAIANEHYDAVRCLVQHGAVCDIRSIEHEEHEETYAYDDDYDGGCAYSTQTEYKDIIRTPMCQLASKANAPLDLFDLLATEQSVKGGSYEDRPLEMAVSRGHNENALRLIKLGAPIKGCMFNYKAEYNDELFTYLIPSETRAVFRCVDAIVGDYRKVMRDIPNEVKSKMLHRLFQYIPPADHVRLRFERDVCLDCYISMNEQSFTSDLESLHWWSLLLVNLGWRFEWTPDPLIRDLESDDLESDDLESDDLESDDEDYELAQMIDKMGMTPAEQQLAEKIDDVWRTCRDTCSRVVSLQNMCIQQTRRSMRDFSDESFMSLPVPSNLRKLLMNQHVAEIACEAMNCKMKVSLAERL